jgi:3-deoxy-D-manno-octulosonic-acid transferase
MAGQLIDKARLGRFAGRSLERYIRWVWRTSRITYEPADFRDRYGPDQPVIVAIWHGQFMLIAAANPPGYKTRVMVARHGDAELIAAAISGFGMELIRGAGAGTRQRDRGGVAAM